MSVRKFTKEQKEKFTQDLRDLLKYERRIHCIVRRVSKSGMSRDIDLYLFSYDTESEVIYHNWLTPRIAAALGYSFIEEVECLRIKGCGNDMGQHVIDYLNQILFPEEPNKLRVVHL